MHATQPDNSLISGLFVAAMLFASIWWMLRVVG